MHLQTSIDRNDFIRAFRTIWNERGLADYGEKQEIQWGQIYDKAVSSTGWKFVDWELGGGKTTAAAIMAVLDYRPMAVFVRTKHDADELEEQMLKVQRSLTKAGFDLDWRRNFRALHGDNKDWSDRYSVAAESDVVIMCHATLVLALRDKTKRMYDKYELDSRFVIIDEKVSFLSTFEADDCEFRTLHDMLSESDVREMASDPEAFDREMRSLEDLCDAIDVHSHSRMFDYVPSDLGSFPSMLNEVIRTPMWAEKTASRIGVRRRDLTNATTRHEFTLETAYAVIKNQSVILQDTHVHRDTSKKKNKITELELFIPRHFRQAMVLDATCKVDGQYRDGAFPIGGEVVNLYDEKYGQLSRLRDYSNVEVRYLQGATNSIRAMTSDREVDFWVEKLDKHFAKTGRMTLALATSKVWDRFEQPLYKAGWRNVNPISGKTHEGRMFSPKGTVCLASYARDGRGSNDFCDAEEVILMGMPNLPDWLYKQEAILRKPEDEVDDKWLGSDGFKQAWMSTKYNLLCSDLLQGAARSAMRKGQAAVVWVLGGNDQYASKFKPVLKEHVSREWPGASVETYDFKQTAEKWYGSKEAPSMGLREGQFDKKYGKLVGFLAARDSGDSFKTSELAVEAGWDPKHAKANLRNLKTNRVWLEKYGSLDLEQSGRGRGACWILRKAG